MFHPAVLISLVKRAAFLRSCFHPIVPVLQALSLRVSGISESAPVLPECRCTHPVICSSSRADTGDIRFLPEGLSLCVCDRRVKPAGFLFLKSSKYVWIQEYTQSDISTGLFLTGLFFLLRIILHSQLERNKMFV